MKTGQVKSQETHSESRFRVRGWLGHRVSVSAIGGAVSQWAKWMLSDEAFPLMSHK